MRDFISRLRSQQFWDSVLVALVSLYALGLWIHGVTWMEKVGLFGALLIALFNGRWRRTLPWLRHPLILLLLALIFWLACSAFWSLNPGITVKEAKASFKEYFLIYPPLMYLLQDSRRRQLFAALLAWSGVLISVINGAQYVRELLTDPSLLYYIKGHREWAHPLVICICFALAQLRLSKGKAVGFWLAVLAVESFMIIGSGARAAWLALFAVLALWGCLEFNRRQIFGAVAVGCVLALLGYLVLPPTIVKNRLAQGVDTSHRTTGTWGPTIDMMRDRLVLGYGYGRPIYDAEFNRRAPNEDTWFLKESIGPHSIYLYTGFGGGLSALAGLLILCAGTLGYGLQGSLRATSLDDRLLALAATSAFLGYFVTRGAFESVRWSPLIILLLIIVQGSWAARATRGRACATAAGPEETLERRLLH